MFQTILFVLNVGLLLTAMAFLAGLARMFWKKSLIETTLQVQCSSGDSEVMSFNYNFFEGESEDSKDSKIHEAFVRIQDRRDENHQKWLRVREDAIKENETKDPEDLKLRSVAEARTVQ